MRASRMFHAVDSRTEGMPTRVVVGRFAPSPCGTGAGAHMAQLHLRGDLGLGQDFGSESYIGARRVGRLLSDMTVAGRTAVVPTITGRAWITGSARYLLDPADPFLEDFTF